jgi:nucleotide-binding universal stress UspA family protein
MVRDGPILIAFDGSPVSERALRDAAALLGPRKALVVTVWKEGVGFEPLDLPIASVGMPPAPIDVRTAMEIDQDMQARGQRLAQHGAEMAREAGLDADGLAVADEATVTIAETLVDLARKRDAAAIVVGSHGHGRLLTELLGSTTRDVIRHAECPVIVTRGPVEKDGD